MAIFISLLQVDKELLQMIGSALLCTGKNRKSQMIYLHIEFCWPRVWYLFFRFFAFVICICIVLHIILTSAEVKWNLHNFGGCVYNAFSVHSQVLSVQRNKILPKEQNYSSYAFIFIFISKCYFKEGILVGNWYGLGHIQLDGAGLFLFVQKILYSVDQQISYILC